MALFNKYNPFRQQGHADRRNAAISSSHSQKQYIIDEKAPSPLAIIYRSEIDYISRCVLDYPNIETGGQLFGFWTSQGAPVVLYAIGPGKNANHQRDFFNQDVEYLDLVGNELLNRYALQHIGEWHSHHQLGLARPSGHDAQTMFHGLQRIPQRRLLLCICNYRNGYTTINPFTFHENDMQHYVDAIWSIKEMESPFRTLVDEDMASIISHPHASKANHGSIRTVTAYATSSNNDYFDAFPPNYWLLKSGGPETMKKIMSFIKESQTNWNVVAQRDSGLAQLSINDGEYIFRFSKEFPINAPQLLVRGEEVESPQWDAPQDYSEIFKTFIAWFSQIRF